MGLDCPPSYIDGLYYRPTSASAAQKSPPPFSIDFLIGLNHQRTTPNLLSMPLVLRAHLCTNTLARAKTRMCCVCLFILENDINNGLSNLSAYTDIKPKWAPNISCADEIRERGGDDCSMEQCHAKRIQSVTATSPCLYSWATPNVSNLSLS
jgi:hypothetical protein